VLKLLLDEHISPRVAAQLARKRAGARVAAVLGWQEGRLAGSPDDELIAEARAEGFTLVTYDLATIAPVIREWSEQGIDHAGVIFVDERTIPPNDFGSLVRALASLWDAQHTHDWRNRCVFLGRDKGGRGPSCAS
jgi:hypothetical protein